ncbi:hypothetical protein BD779DRAFT_1489976 [Infundibulicybe gibba]|nr:hypothetical protein BD779DRAFT_1489976 [Infundibulicybe gibba]
MSTDSPTDVLDDVGPTTRTPRRYPAIVHIAVLTAFVAPLAVLPFMLSRRTAVSLKRNIEELGGGIRILQDDMNRMSSELRAHKDESRRARALLHEIMQEADELHSQVDEDTRKRQVADKLVQSRLQGLADEIKNLRAQTNTLRALGASLADVAAFMHQVELEVNLPAAKGDGSQRKPIERLRVLALELENLPNCQTKAESKLRETQ